MGTTEDWGRTYQYSSDGRLRSSTHTDADTQIPTTTYGMLDAFKQRVAKVVEVDGVPTEELLRPNELIELRDGLAVRTAWAGGQRIAETSEEVIDAASTATFFWEDHQGQQVAAAEVGRLLWPTVTVDSVSQVRRDPWGESLDGDESLLTRAASGGELQAGGETYLGWRLYDPQVGKFMQPDALSTGAGQGMNRYRYGWNSPSNFTDPSGYFELGLVPPTMGRMAGQVGVAPSTGPMGSGVVAGPVVRGMGAGFSENERGYAKSWMWMCVGKTCFHTGLRGSASASQASSDDEPDVTVCGDPSRSGYGDVDCGTGEQRQKPDRRGGATRGEPPAPSAEEAGSGWRGIDDALAAFLLGRAQDEFEVARKEQEAWLDAGQRGDHPHLQQNVANGEALLDASLAARGDKAALRRVTAQAASAVVLSRLGGNRFRGPRAKGFNWGHIFERHSAAGSVAKQRGLLDQIFSGLSEGQIKSRVKAAWKNRRRIKSQTDGLGVTRVRYRGVDPKSGKSVDMWHNEQSGIVESAFPSPGG